MKSSHLRAYRLNLERPFNILNEQSPLEYGDYMKIWDGKRESCICVFLFGMLFCDDLLDHVIDLGAEIWLGREKRCCVFYLLNIILYFLYL